MKFSVFAIDSFVAPPKCGVKKKFFFPKSGLQRLNV